MVFISLDGALRCVDAMVCWLYELPLAILFLEEGFDGRCALVISDVNKVGLCPLSFNSLNTDSNASMMVSSFRLLIGFAKI